MIAHAGRAQDSGERGFFEEGKDRRSPCRWETWTAGRRRVALCEKDIMQIIGANKGGSCGWYVVVQSGSGDREGLV